MDKKPINIEIFKHKFSKYEEESKGKEYVYCIDSDHKDIRTSKPDLKSLACYLNEQLGRLPAYSTYSKINFMEESKRFAEVSFKGRSITKGLSHEEVENFWTEYIDVSMFPLK